MISAFFFAKKSIVYKTSIIIDIILLRNVRALLIAVYATFASAFRYQRLVKLLRETRSLIIYDSALNRVKLSGETICK